MRRQAKFTTAAHSPRLTIIRTTRRAVVNDVAEIITLHEAVTKIELTLPSFVRGIRDACRNFVDALSSMFLPRIYAL